ncbi:hypothetical protein CAAN4_A01860 [[Candida] anglica]|uniref:Uncharacterized protein n=1 Tax=[Candida] anglica TaxID=148631 RepID=A0ABP0E5B8_9ASCO
MTMKPSNPNLFASSTTYNNDNYDHFPTVEEIVAELKLLRAFSELKSKVVGSPECVGPDGRMIGFSIEQLKAWQVYLTNASRRFIIYVSALKARFKKSDQSSPKGIFQEFFNVNPFENGIDNFRMDIIKNEKEMKLASKQLQKQMAQNPGDFSKIEIPSIVSEIFPGFKVMSPQNSGSFAPICYSNSELSRYIYSHLPPLDVLFIWHCFMLSHPQSKCVEQFREFFMCSFPLYQVTQAIDNSSFNYCPSNIVATTDEFHRLTRNFGNEIDYEVLKVDMNMKVPITCPVCNKTLIQEVEFTNSRDRGFADSGFVAVANPNDAISKLPRCTCLRSALKVTHEELTKLRIPGNILTTAQEMKGWNYQMFGKEVGDEMANRIQNAVEDSMQYQQERGHRPSRPRSKTRNLIYLTIPRMFDNQDIIAIDEDLVNCAIFQERFSIEINSLQWLKSNALESTIEASSRRYYNFFQLMRDTYLTTYHVPPIDINLVWNVHRLCPIAYRNYQRFPEHVKTILCPTIPIGDSKLSACFENTCSLYRKRFNEELSNCLCWFCSIARRNSRPKISKMFSGSDEIPGSNFLSNVVCRHTGVNPSHISGFNSITIEGVKANEVNSKVKKRYGLENSERPYPWYTGCSEMEALVKYSYVFVNDPTKDIAFFCPWYTGTKPHPSEYRWFIKY